MGVGALFDLSGRVAVVTGATGRLGSVMTRTIAAAGAQTWAVARNASRLTGLAEEIAAAGFDCRPHPCDVTVDADVALLGQALQRSAGRLDVLIHNAHVGRSGSLRSSTPDDFLAASDLALGSFKRLLDATGDLLVRAAEDSSPSVITVASMYGLVSPRPDLYATEAERNPPYYGAAKAALLQLTRYAAVELAPLGIRVNSITPGAFPPGGDEEFLDRLGRATPLGRVGSPEEIATAVLYLASPRSSYVTGSNVVVDGGWTAW